MGFDLCLYKNLSITVDCDFFMIHTPSSIYRIDFEEDSEDDEKAHQIANWICTMELCKSCNTCTIDLLDGGICVDCCKVLVFYKNIPNDKCSICLEPLANYTLTKTKCNHFFHTKCFSRLMKQNQLSCPLCRTYSTKEGTILVYNPMNEL